MLGVLVINSTCKNKRNLRNHITYCTSLTNLVIPIRQWPPMQSVVDVSTSRWINTTDCYISKISAKLYFLFQKKKACFLWWIANAVINLNLCFRVKKITNFNVKKVTGLDVLMSELPSKLFLCSTWPDGMIVNKNCFVAPLLEYLFPRKKRITKNHFHIRFLDFQKQGFFFKIQTATNGRKAFVCSALRASYVCHKNWSSFSETGRGQLLILLLNILHYYCSSTLPLH
jgi:hypothetical protein